MTALLTRYLGPVQYGEYSFVLSLLAILILLSGNGIDPLILRQLSRKPREEWCETLSYAVGTRLVIIALIVGATVLTAMMLPISAEPRNLLLLGSFSLFFSFSVGSLRTTFEVGFRAEQRVSMISLLTTIDRIVTAGLVGLTVFFHLSLLWTCFLIIYSDLPFFFIQVVLARRNFGVQVRFNIFRAHKLFVQALPLMGHNIMSLIAAQADLLLLMALAESPLIGEQNMGLYALASRITDPLLSIVLAYVLGLYPLLCAKFGEGRERFAKVYHEAARILALAIIPLAILVSVEANAIVALLGGQRFAAAAIAVQLLMWAMAATFFNQLAMRACMAVHKERQMMYVTFVSSGINICANLVLIPHWQIVGAGVAALTSELVGLGLFTLVLRHHIRLFSTLSLLLRVVLGNLPMLLFLIWQQRAPLLLTIPLALVLSVVGCLMTHVLSVKDFRLARHIVDMRRNSAILNANIDKNTITPNNVVDS
jgi:O-antigen/teichoic acid export membrane protein